MPPAKNENSSKPHPAKGCGFFRFVKLPKLVAVGGFSIEAHIACRHHWSALMSTIQNEQSPLALRPRDAAKVLGISPRTLWQWTRDGVVPSVRVGSGQRKILLYPIALLQEWLERNAQGAKGMAHA